MAISFEKGRPSDDQTEMEPLGIEDFQLQFLALAAFCSIGLIVNLGELLVSQDTFYLSGYRLVLCGLVGCLSVTCLNIGVFVSLVVKDDLSIDWKLAASRKTIAYGICGFGAVTSLVFIVGCLIKYLGLYLVFTLTENDQKYLETLGFTHVDMDPRNANSRNQNKKVCNLVI